jgi:hypothetical protein
MVGGFGRPLRPSDSRRPAGETMMSDLVYVLLTLAIFALLGLLVKAVERL